MSLRSVRVARIYLSESGGEAERLLTQLRDTWKVHGVTVYRGVAGYGDSRRVHTARLLDVSYDLPIVIEFYDRPDRIDAVLSGLQGIKPQHVLTWLADTWTQEPHA
jgi:PII-like signaling protein